MEILFIVLFAYMRKIRENRLKKALGSTASKVSNVLPLQKAASMAKQSVPAIMR